MCVRERRVWCRCCRMLQSRVLTEGRFAVEFLMRVFGQVDVGPFCCRVHGMLYLTQEAVLCEELGARISPSDV